MIPAASSWQRWWTGVQSPDRAWARVTLLGTVLAAAFLLGMPDSDAPFWYLMQRDEVTVLPYFILAALFPFLPAVSGMRFERLPLWLARHAALTSVLLTVLLCIGTLIVYRAHPVTMDEYAPWFQAGVFATGKLFAAYPTDWLFHLVDQSYHGSFFIINWKTGELASSYWPGYALLLAPFMALGIPWACNPLLVGLSLYVLWRIALRLFAEPEMQGWVLLLALASPAFTLNGISFYSMPAHLLLNLVFVLLLLDPRPARLLLAGLTGSLALVLHNPLPHILFALPWVLWLALRPGGMRKLGLLLVGYLPLALLLGGGWAWLRMTANCSPACAAASALPAIPAAAASLGDWAGQGWAMATSAFVIPDMRLLELRGGATVKLWLSAAPGLVVLAVLGMRRPLAPALVPLAASAVLTFVVFLFVPLSQGHGWGYRYFHSAWGCLPLLAVAALDRMSRPGDDRGQLLKLALARMAVYGLIVLTAVKIFVMGTFVDEHLSQLPPTSGRPGDIVFVRGLGYYGIDLVENPPALDGDRLMLLSRGRRMDREFLKRNFPDAELVGINYYGWTWHVPLSPRGAGASASAASGSRPLRQ